MVLLLKLLGQLLQVLILVLIAVPSFALLYSLDEVVDPAVTIKANRSSVVLVL